jgi:hypothetical protein
LKPASSDCRLATTLRNTAMVWLALLSCGASVAAVDPDPASLARGEFVWHPEISPSGPIVLVVSLDEQRLYVYRNGVAIGVSTISSGRKGHETPPGVFTILQKEVEHYSNRYDDAPMPFMERLTWDGVAMHGGSLPGYPASHGCIRLPHPFARKLFDITTRGVTVMVASSKSAPATTVHPATLAPITATGNAMQAPVADEAFTWRDLPMEYGPVSILVSTSDRAIFVFRNGILIATTHFIGAVQAVGGSILYVMGDGMDYVPSALDPTRPKHRWDVYPLATRRNPAPRLDAPGAYRVAPEFARHVYDLLAPGTTVLVTDLPAMRGPVDSKPERVLESTAIREPPRS